MTVAHFGEGDAYAAEAAGQLYPDAELASCRSFADVMRAAGAGVMQLISDAYQTPDDAFAVIGAIFELVSRQMRTGRPASAQVRTMVLNGPATVMLNSQPLPPGPDDKTHVVTPDRKSVV